ncbi:MAG: hypothetical protein ACRELU_09290 [Gemmatimonadota bacterium]
MIRTVAAAGLAVLTMGVAPAAAQFGDLIDRAGDAIGQVPSLGSFLEGDPPITTSLDDARTEIAFLDAYSPGVWAPMDGLPRTSSGAFRLRPGRYALEAQSYCMHAGTHGPGGGDGYLYAPLAGPKAPIVRSILRNSVAHPEIQQRNIQVLIWAIIARTEFDEMPGEVQRTARTLLTEDELDELDDGALGMVPESVMREAMGQLPPVARQVFQAEARLRSMLSGGSASFAELERVAVLTGAATPTADSRPVPEGRWSYHPDGFFVRYAPHGYSRTRIEIVVPRPVTMERDPEGRIVAVVEASGRKVEVAYDDASAEVSGDSGVRAHGIESVLVVASDGSATPLSGGAGWTLVGRPEGGGRPSGTGRFADLAERYRSAVDWRDEWRDLTSRPMSDRALSDALDLAQLQLAIESSGETPGGGSASGRAFQEALISLAEAWQSAVCASAGCPSISGARDVLVLRNGDVRLGNLLGCGGNVCLFGGSSVGLELIAWIGLATAGLPPSAQQMGAGEVHLESGTVRPGDLRAIGNRYVLTSEDRYDRSMVRWVHLAGAGETPPSLVMPGAPDVEARPEENPDEEDEGDGDPRNDEDRGEGGGGGAFTFDPSDDVATPGNRSRQRLATSGRPQGGEDSADDDMCTSGFPEDGGLVSIDSCPPCAAEARNLNQAAALMDADIVDFDTWNDAFWGYAECLEAHGVY